MITKVSPSSHLGSHLRTLVLRCPRIEATWFHLTCSSSKGRLCPSLLYQTWMIEASLSHSSRLLGQLHQAIIKLRLSTPMQVVLPLDQSPFITAFNEESCLQLRAGPLDYTCQLPLTPYEIYLPITTRVRAQVYQALRDRRTSCPLTNKLTRWTWCTRMTHRFRLNIRPSRIQSGA